MRKDMANTSDIPTIRVDLQQHQVPQEEPSVDSSVIQRDQIIDRSQNKSLFEVNHSVQPQMPEVYQLPISPARNNYPQLIDNSSQPALRPDVPYYHLIPHGTFHPLKTEEDNLLSNRQEDNLSTHQGGNNNPVISDENYQGQINRSLNNSPAHYQFQPVVMPANAATNDANALSSQRWAFKNFRNNYRRLTTGQKVCIFATMSVMFAGYAIAFVFLFRDLIIPRLQLVKRFQFFCVEKNTWTDKTDVLCFISIAQVSFGVISIGQVSIGVITIGQVCIGVVILLTQIGIALIYVLLSQIVLAPIVQWTMFAFSVLWTRGAFIAFSPLSPFFRANPKYPFTIGCK